MRIKTSAVFLSGSLVQVKKKGVTEEKFLGKFHQPKENDNSLLSIVFPPEAKDELQQYSEYEIEGKLNSWVFNSQVMSRIEAVSWDVI